MVQCLRVWQTIGFAILMSMVASGQARRILRPSRGERLASRAHPHGLRLAIEEGADFIEPDLYLMPRLFHAFKRPELEFCRDAVRLSI